MNLDRVVNTGRSSAFESPRIGGSEEPGGAKSGGRAVPAGYFVKYQYSGRSVASGL